jgi:fibronectin type 3 domain-containing protein
MRLIAPTMADMMCLWPSLPLMGLLFSIRPSLGGSSTDRGTALALDAAGNAWVTGHTESTDFPATPDAFDPTHNGGAYDVFVAQLTADGPTLGYSTFLGGSNFDFQPALAVSAAGNVWITGRTFSRNFPTTPDVFDPTYNGFYDVFLCALMPSPPQTLSATMSRAKAAVLTWEPPRYEGIAPVTTYRVYRSTASGLYSSYLAETTEPSFIDWTIVPGYTYYYAVAATHKFGEGARSGEVSMMVAIQPSAPQHLYTHPGEDFIALEWHTPKYEGAAPIMSYRVYRGTASGEFLLLGVAISPRFTDTTALGGVTYYYVITAVNEFGESPFSNEVSIALLAGPSAPQTLIALPGNASIALHWNASRNDGGSVITFYRVHRGIASGQYQFLGVTASMAFNDTAAEAGKLYYYVVTAANAIGESSFSNEVMATTASPLGASESQDSSAPSLLAIIVCLSVAALRARKRKER